MFWPMDTMQLRRWLAILSTLPKSIECTWELISAWQTTEFHHQRTRRSTSKFNVCTSETSCQQEFHHFICNTLLQFHSNSIPKRLFSYIHFGTISICNGLTGTPQRNNVANYFDTRVSFTVLLYSWRASNTWDRVSEIEIFEPHSWLRRQSDESLTENAAIISNAQCS